MAPRWVALLPGGRFAPPLRACGSYRSCPRARALAHFPRCAISHLSYRTNLCAGIHQRRRSRNSSRLDARGSCAARHARERCAQLLERQLNSNVPDRAFVGICAHPRPPGLWPVVVGVRPVGVRPRRASVRVGGVALFSAADPAAVPESFVRGILSAPRAVQHRRGPALGGRGSIVFFECGIVKLLANPKR